MDSQEAKAAKRVAANHRAGAHDGAPCLNRHCPDCQAALQKADVQEFEALEVGDTFEFDHYYLPFCGGLAHGPWVKLSQQRYRAVGSDGPVHRVGTRHVSTIRLQQEEA